MPIQLPDHLYTATKLAGEMYCRSYSALYGLQCTVLRFGIPYGPRARPAGVIPIFVRKALAGEPLTIAGEGRQSRRFVYVEDLAQGIVRSLVPQAIGRTYNLVGEESVTVRAIADTVRDLVGDVDIVHTPARTADFAGAEVSGARAATELGWYPATSFDEGVRRYFEWHRRDAAQPSAPAPARIRRLRRRPRVAPRFVSAVLSWLTVFAVAGVLAAYLAAVHAVGVTADSDRTVAVLAVSTLAGYLAMALDGRRRALWTFTGWALAAAGLVARLHARVPRGACSWPGPTSRGSCSAWPAARWRWPSPTSACGCAAAATSAWPRTAPRASRSPGPRARRPRAPRAARARCASTSPPRCRCRRRGAARRRPRDRSRVARAAIAAGLARAAQSRPQRDHSSPRQPRRRRSASPAALYTP